MKDYIIEIIAALVLAGVCGILAQLLKTRRAEIKAVAHELVQKAESTVRGSGLGPEKKALVVAQLEAMGIKLDSWLDAAIDAIVKELNDKHAWYCKQAGSLEPEEK